MANINIYNLTLQKQEQCNKRTLNTAFKHYDLDKCTLPVVAKLNGKCISRKDWVKRLKKNDVVEFHIMPQGGGDSDIARIVATLAVIVVAVWAGPALVQYLGFEGLTATAVSVTTSAAIVAAGTFAVNTLLPPPMPKIQGINYNENASSTYSLQAQGNSARIGDAVPVVYGRHMIYADFGAMPYSYFENNEQYLNQLFVIGMGEYDIEKIRIEDTDIGNFKEIEYQIVNPEEQITLFDHNCVNATEVAMQTLTSDDYQGPFTLNKADSIIKAIEVDFAAPRGLYHANDNGILSDKSVNVVVEARKLDEEEFPIGDWIEIINETITANLNSEIRKSYKVDVEPARYEVRVKRTTVESTSTREADQIVWAGLKGFLNQEITYPDMTLVAMKMRATDNLSQTTSRKVNFIVNRKLPIWNEATGWSEPQVTQSISWALADICRASYGGNLSDDQINLRQLAYLDTVYTQAGDTFNAVFDSKLELLEALTRVGKVSRTFGFIQAGKINFVRDHLYDELEAEPTMVFNANNIVENSWKIEYLLPTSETIDYAEVTYFDDRTWASRTFDVALDENKKTKKTQMTMFGVTNKDQARRQAEYYLKTNKYRRRVVTFDTELEGAIPTIGSLIRLSYPLPKWGTSGFVESYDSETQVLTLSESVQIEDGKEYYICLRNSKGQSEKSIKVIRELENKENQVTLSESPSFEIYTGDKKENTHFIFGSANEVNLDAKVNAILPRDQYTITITATMDDSRVYT